MHFGKAWIIAGLLAVAIAAVGLGIATAGPPDQTGADGSGGVFSRKLGL